MRSNLEILDTNSYGRGVFAKQPIKKGALLEKAPILLLPKDQWSDLEKTTIYDYCFYWRDDFAIALGIGSLFNHSYSPNTLYKANFTDNTMDFHALKDISEGEEILVNYNGNPEDNSPLWFDVKEKIKKPGIK